MQKWVVISNWLSRLISIGIQLVTIPMLTKTLGQEGFGAYAVIVSLAAWYGLTDIGIGKSLQNFIGECKAKKEDFGHYIVISGIHLFCLVGVFLALIYLLSPQIGPFLMNGFKFISPDQAELLIFISGIVFLGYMLGLVTNQVLYAMGKGIYANLLTIITNCAFIVLLFLIEEKGNFEALFLCVMAYLLPQGSIGLLSYLIVLIKYGKFKKVKTKGTLSSFYKRSIRFSIFSIMAVLALNVDYIIMSRTLKPDDIAVYNILYRIFWVGMSFYSGLLAAAWPLFTGWAALNEWNKLIKSIRNHILFGVSCVAVMAIVLWFILPYIYKYIAPGFNVNIEIGTVALFSGYIALRIWCDTFSTALQTMSNLSTLIKWLPLQALISVFSQYFMAKEYGVNGILYGLIMSFSLTMAWVLPIRLFKIFKKNPQNKYNIQ